MVAVLKAMGLESDQEALQLAGCDGASASLLVPTLQDCKALNVFTQRQALEYLGATAGARLPDLGRPDLLLRDAIGAPCSICMDLGALPVPVKS